MSGLHRSPRTGFSTEFTEYRQYSPGDDVRFLDWKVWREPTASSLRSLRMRPTAVHVHGRFFQVDGVWRRRCGVKKSDYGRTFAASLAWFLTQQRDAVGLATFDPDLASSSRRATGRTR
ncbi:MAG: hypothetical protein CM1200mP34_1240 [Verrucomicrobiales bacterium]|nr:MAG: hypothetical protein CM1200mP34_1240 [Verrucomicrobiales bacterium]